MKKLLGSIILFYSIIVNAGILDKYEGKDINNSKYFIGGYLGLNNIDVSKEDKIGSVNITSKPETNGFDLGLELGYRYDVKSFSTISYTKSLLGDVHFDNVLLSYNRKFFENNPEIYLGVVGGMSYIEDRKNHITGEITDAKGSEVSTYGLQVGYENDFKKEGLSWFIRYRYLKAKHITNLIQGPEKSLHIRDNQSHIVVGLRFNFNNTKEVKVKKKAKNKVVPIRVIPKNISKKIVKIVPIIHYDDNDSVEYKKDMCPNTPKGYAVDTNGCISNFKFTDVRFNTAEYKIKIKFKIVLNKLSVFLNKYPDLNITIIGHTDNQGYAKNNEILSNKRSKEVEKFLLLRGIKKDRISIKYLGETQPIKSNATALGRKMNRRVEIFISDKKK